jgi:predicted ATPase
MAKRALSNGNPCSDELPSFIDGPKTLAQPEGPFREARLFQLGDPQARRSKEDGEKRRVRRRERIQGQALRERPDEEAEVSVRRLQDAGARRLRTKASMCSFARREMRAADLLDWQVAMPVQLTSITVEGFKSIATMELNLNDLNVLIGANGAGKSNFVALFTLLGQLVENRVQLYVGKGGGPDALLTYGRRHTERLTIDLRFGSNRYRANLIPTEADELIFEDEVCFFYRDGHPTPYALSLDSAGRKETRLQEKGSTEAIAKHVLEAMRGWRVYHFHDTSPAARVKQLGDIGDNALLRADAANLAAFLLNLRDTQQAQYRQIVETVRLVAPFFHDFQLRPNPSSPEKIRLEWSGTSSESYFNANALSDGTLRFVCLATLLLQPTLPSVIVIDEPELGLHPYAITLLASLLRSAAKRTQVIVSTQSVTLVNQFGPENIVVVDRDTEGSTFSRPRDEDTASWLDDYSLGEMWEKNVLGGRPR